MRLEAGRFFGRVEESILLSEIRISEHVYPASAVYARHSHECAHLCVVLEGAYVEWLEGRTAERRPGDLIYYPPGAEHAETHRATGRHLLVEIAQSRFGSWSEECRSLDRAGSVAAGRARSLGGRLRDEFAGGGPAARLALEGLVLELVAEVARSSARADSRRPRWLDRVVERIRSDYARALTLDALAAEAGVHSAHLVREFRRHEGATVGDFLRHVRIEAARERLAASDEPLAAMAVGLGFSDQPHFTRAFKSATGTTPGAYRRSRRARSDRSNRRG